mmetsp:Transcript_33382/g.83674  ORF Transcript_33382/g.83674 Transcript_33382/m.83674 type:complete len:568 (+) Transcript_33382:328-2031(+)
MAESTQETADVKKESAQGASHVWKRRWQSDVLWIAALLTAADRAKVAAHWRDTNPHGKKLAMEARLYDALKEDCPPHTEELPSGRSLLQRLQQMVETWRAGEARKDAMNDSQWQAALKQQRDDSPLRKGQAGYAVWNSIHEYLLLLGWVDAECDEDDPLCPDEVTVEVVEEYRPLLLGLDEALAAKETRESNRKNDRDKAARADNRKEKGGRAAERLATATGNRKETLESMRPEGRSNAPSNGEEAEWEPSQGDEGELPELDQVLELTATEQRLLRLCSDGESFHTLPLLSAADTELPEPWCAMDCQHMTELKEMVVERDLPVLVAHNILQQQAGSGGSSNSGSEEMLQTMERLESLAHFPYNLKVGEGGTVPGKDTSPEELAAFRAKRRDTVMVELRRLKGMRQEQQLQKLKYVGLLISEAASRSLHERIITSTPERNQKWSDAVQACRESGAGSGSGGRKRQRTSRSSTTRITKAAELDEQLHQEMIEVREFMAEERERRQEQTEVFKDLKQGMRGMIDSSEQLQTKMMQGFTELSNSQKQTAAILSRLGDILQATLPPPAPRPS